MGRSFGILFFGAVGRQVPEFVRHPVTQPVIAPTTVGIDVYAATGEVSEHLAGHTCGHMKAVNLGSVEELPVRHKDDATGKDFGLHDLNPGAQQCLLSRRGSLDRVGGGRSRGWVFARIGVPQRVPRGLCPAD